MNLISVIYDLKKYIYERLSGFHLRKLLQWLLWNILLYADGNMICTYWRRNQLRIPADLFSSQKLSF